MIKQLSREKLVGDSDVKLTSKMNFLVVFNCLQESLRGFLILTLVLTGMALIKFYE